MTTSILLQKINPQYHLDVLMSSAKEKMRGCLTAGKTWCVYVFDRHTDVISSVGILAITTCLLAAKLFKGIPEVVPRLARLMYNFGGVIWLNIQVKEFLKSGSDLMRSLRDRECRAVLETSAKVFVEATNIFLTCAFFSAAAVALCGFPHISTSIYASLRSVSLVALAITVVNDVDIANTVKDYFENRAVLSEMKKMSANRASGNVQVEKLTKCFLEIIASPDKNGMDEVMHRQEWRMASRIVRQLDMQTIEAFKDRLTDQKGIKFNSIQFFDELQKGMMNSQTKTMNKLGLRTLGYLAMAICKAYPDTLIEVSLRWGMSVLYTAELLRDKMFKSKLSLAT